MASTDAFERAQRRHPALGVPIAVVYKLIEDQGLYLAAIIAFYGMFAIFPLMLLLSSLVGFALASRPDLQQEIIDSAVQQVPLFSETFVRRQLTGSGASFVIGAVGALLGALGVGTAVQNAMNVIWSVPRHRRPNPVLLRLRSLSLLFVLLAFVLVSTFLSQFDPQALGLGWPAVFSSGFGTVASFLVTTITFGFVTRLAARTRLSFVERLPGALLGALLWQMLQSAGSAYVRTYIANATIADGVFSSLMGLLLWIFLAGVILVVALEFNVVVVDRLYPRSLGAIFVDSENLTEADRRVYARRAKAERFKTFQRVDVGFVSRDESTDALRQRLSRLREATANVSGRLPVIGRNILDPMDSPKRGSLIDPSGEAALTRRGESTRPPAGDVAAPRCTRNPEGASDAAGHSGEGSRRRAHDEAAS